MKTIKFPTNKSFTAKEIHSRYVNIYKNSKTKKAITYTGLFLKLKKQISLGNIEVVGTKPAKGRGRPQVIYKVTASAQTEEKGIAPEAGIGIGTPENERAGSPESTPIVETPAIIEINVPQNLSVEEPVAA